ncbi:FeoA family protein [Vibrio panuliri]|uniref:Iron transporter n=1 Tax=Vibrio panuliri TaxID=1381081 RepID=A0A1Q9HRW2_9VIBR|nr:FeoA family protein [Vibrio panuliri]KAB1457924.1 ferrous iron transport protein A [Vibrio panuliri]OLQ93593.1 iron transporter [Vibrio panuliri]OLQ95657.1 iron transporter [Vibrio panuliri]
MKQMLTELKPGEVARVVGHQSQGLVRQRLLDLGLIPQTEIKFIRYAPLGDPIEIKVGYTHVVIRASEAETVIVESQA